VEATTPLPQVITDLITAPGHITEEAQSWSRLAIDLTIGVPDIGMDARITSGDQVIGYGGMASKCGFVAITSCEDTKRRECRIAATSAGLPSRHQSTQQAQKSADERF
jgi:hypothetical protein